MGTFIGHLVPGLALTLLGLWHTLNTTKSHNLTTQTWFPFPKIKHLELYLILSFSLLALAFQLSVGGNLSDLEHATMFLHVSLYAAAALFSKNLAGILAASAFGQELFLLHFHSTDHAGLEGRYHWLLQLIVAACLAATVLSVGMPGSSAVAVARSAAVTCQGAWMVVMGFALWVPRLAPEGCYLVGAAVECGSEEAEARAVGIADLRFSWTVAGVMAVVVAVSVVADWKGREYEKLRSGCCGEGADECVKSAGGITA